MNNDALSRVRAEAPYILSLKRDSNQISKAIEEMAELTVELSRVNSFRYNIAKAQEEIADVLIMIHQMRELYGDLKVDEFIHAKLDRVLGEKITD